MKYQAYWALKNRFRNFVTDTMSPSVYAPILFHTKTAAEAYAEKHVPEALKPKAVRVSLTLVEKQLK